MNVAFVVGDWEFALGGVEEGFRSLLQGGIGGQFFELGDHGGAHLEPC